MERGYQWNGLTEEGGNDVDIDLVDLVGVKKRGDQRPSSKCVTRRGTQTLRKCLPGRHEFHSWQRSFRRLPREHGVAGLCVEHPVVRALQITLGHVGDAEVVEKLEEASLCLGAAGRRPLFG
jgi:hypothetical protein